MYNTYQELAARFGQQTADYVFRLRLRDDIMMRYAFRGQKKDVRMILSKLLGRKLPALSSLETQSFLPSVIKKSKIFDLHAVDRNGEVYILESQNRLEGDEVQRALSYASSECHFMVNRGCPYSDLKPINVITLTGGDAIGRGKPIYSISLRAEELGFEELSSLVFRLYFINMDAPFDGTERWYICHDLNCSKEEDMHYTMTRKLLQLGHSFNIGGNNRMCESLEKFEMQAIDKGIAKGLAEGRAEERKKVEAEFERMRNRIISLEAELKRMKENSPNGSSSMNC